MQAIYDLLMSMTAMLFAIAGLAVVHDLWVELEFRRSLAKGVQTQAPSPSRWKVSVTLALLAWVPLLIALAMMVFTAGRVGVHASDRSNAKVQAVAQARAPQAARAPHTKAKH